MTQQYFFQGLSSARDLDLVEPPVTPPQSTPNTGGDIAGIVRSVRLEDIHCDYLNRDAPATDPNAFAALVASIRDLGLLTPLLVSERAAGGYDLVQGNRRLQACRVLHETQDTKLYAEVAAIILPARQCKDVLYRRMVDDNLCRRTLSFAEMAFLAANYAADNETAATDLNEAIGMLYGSFSNMQRRNIRIFARLMARIGDTLKFPSEISVGLGIDIAARLDLYPPLADILRERLKGWSNRSIADEIGVLCDLAREPFELIRGSREPGSVVRR